MENIKKRIKTSAYLILTEYEVSIGNKSRVKD